MLLNQLGETMIDILVQFWWAGLIPAVIAILVFLWHRQYQKTHVEAQCVVLGSLTLGTIILIYYIVCIIASMFSILGFFVNLFK